MRTNQNLTKFSIVIIGNRELKHLKHLSYRFSKESHDLSPYICEQIIAIHDHLKILYNLQKKCLNLSEK
jgi:hypothetical protein